MTTLRSDQPVMAYNNLLVVLGVLLERLGGTVNLTVMDIDSFRADTKSIYWEHDPSADFFTLSVIPNASTQTEAPGPHHPDRPGL